jgi:hypothetical protein
MNLLLMIVFPSSIPVFKVETKQIANQPTHRSYRLQTGVIEKYIADELSSNS